MAQPLKARLTTKNYKKERKVKQRGGRKRKMVLLFFLPISPKGQETIIIPHLWIPSLHLPVLQSPGKGVLNVWTFCQSWIRKILRGSSQRGRDGENIDRTSGEL